MDLGIPAKTPSKCHFKDCPSHKLSPNLSRIVRNGSFYRSSDARRLTRFLCRHCKRGFSQASASTCYRQKRRNLNSVIQELYCSGNTQRRLALVLRTTRRTIVRKILFMAMQAELRHKRFLQNCSTEGTLFTALQFDEMETFEHSKCLPLSIPLVVDAESRKILAIRACSMPAKGLLAEISRKKYGPRKDHRARVASSVLSSLKHVVDANAHWLTDQNPKYPNWLGRHFPQAKHSTTPGRRGCVVGQGELKRGGRDPLFVLNHSCAMIRANVSRLFRRTWNTTKKREHLNAHLMLYLDYHNRVLLAS